MSKSKKVNAVDLAAPVEFVTDSKVGHALKGFDTDYWALVSEVVKDGVVEGTILYIPGVDYKTLRLTES